MSLTPFGRTGPRAEWQTTDLVAAALGGVLSVSGLPDQPVNPWGRQCFNVAGFLAAVSGLAGVHAAESTGAGQHIDLSLHEAVCTTIEQLFFQYWFDDVQAVSEGRTPTRVAALDRVLRGGAGGVGMADGDASHRIPSEYSSG